MPLVVGRRRACVALVTLNGALACNPRVTTIGSLSRDAASEGRYIEAESGTLSGGFMIEDDSTASGGRFITPQVGIASDGTEPGPARATYDAEADSDGTYLIWARIQAADLSVNRFWFQVDGGAWIKWRITTGNIWFWDQFHDNIDYGTPLPQTLSAGPHQFTIANCVDGVAIDALYYAPDDSKPVGDSTKCDPPNSIDIDGGCQPSCGSLGGMNCGTTECMGLPTVSVYDCSACCPATLP
ncbi:MAG TPA: hypothetical protein VHV51_15090 [Polyangiaceae bacterium]|nr:hypothetical protein [Polyangiaceae bacterium]